MPRVVDFVGLFDARGIPYSPPGTGQHSVDNIGINCPFCAAERDPDPSMHLGINIVTGAWSCWRNHRHRGRQAHRLLSILLRCSETEARRIAGEARTGAAGLTDILERVTSIFTAPTETAPSRGLSPAAAAEWKSFTSLSSALADQHRAYLTSRALPPEQLAPFGVRAGVLGRWAGRLIFPIVAAGEVLSWTARTIYPRVEPRYRALAELKPGGVFGGENVKAHLYNTDRLTGGRSLIITEGVMDAIKVDLMTPADCHATCLFGVNLTEQQGYQIVKLAARYKEVVVLFDSDASISASFTARWAGNSRIANLDIDVADPGDLDPTNPTHIEGLHRCCLS